MNIKHLLVTGVAAFALALPTAAQAQQRRFDIPSAPASRTVAEFGRQSGLQIIASADDLAGITTASVRGDLDARAALRAMIANTALEIASDSNGVIVLRRRATTSVADPIAEDGPAIVVTGSRLAEAGQPLPNPVVSLAGDRIIGRNGGISVGDQLSLLPQFRTTATQSASTAVGTQAPGQVGLNLLDLRGLGTTRTLVLQNGRRLVSSTQQLSQPDTNTIPVELIERIEILTGGASSIYGADAIAGVVNFVLKSDFEGLRLRAQAGVSERGDAGTQSLGLVAGTNFAGGRGNVAVALEYANRDGLRYTDRRFSRGQSDFINNPLAGQPGQPSNIPINDIRYLGISTGGTLPYGPPFYRFQPNGSLLPATTGVASYPNLGISDGGDGYSPIAEGSLLPDNERYSGTLLAHYDVSDAVTLFAQGDYIWQRSSAFGSSSIETFFLSKTNPYLSAQALSVLNSYGPTAAGPSLVMVRSLNDVGVFGEQNTRQTYRGVVGAKGELTDHLRYELSYSYGRTDIRTDFFNNVNSDRAALAADAVRDVTGVLGTAGAIVCAARLAAPTSTNPDIATCQPANYFGDGNVSQAARDYIATTTTARGRIQQHLLGGFLAGDTGAFLNLPGGPASFVLGGEYRRESTRYTPDPLDTVGNTQASAAVTRGSVKVTEGYAELKLPLLADVPGAKRLELTASGRVSDYSLDRVGTTTSWGVGGLWQPLADLTLRASYQRAVRAPNIAELFQPTLNSVAQIIDPCDSRFIARGTPTRQANCAALSLPANYRTATIPIQVATTTSGNPDLDVERGTTYTFGALLTPRFLPGLSLAVDYYNVELRGAIAQANSNIINPATVPAQCVDAPDLNNPFCGLVTRSANGTLLAIRQQPINLTRLTASGIDGDLRYGFRVGAARIDLRGIVSYVIDRDDYRSPFRPDFRTQVAETPSNPRWQANFSTDLTVAGVQLSHRVRYFSGVYFKNDDVQFFESVNGLPPSDPNRRAAEFRKTPDGWYHDLRLALRVAGDSELYFGVDNVADRKPPISIYGAGFGGAQFDSIGRYFYAGLRVSM